MPCGFSKNLISSIVCPKDGHVLQAGKIIQEDENKIIEGFLVCPGCGTNYEIKGGILDLLAGQAGLGELLKTEIIERDNAASGYDDKLASRRDKEIPSTTAQFGDVRGKNIIEYGCGTGRITMETLNAENILAVDFSRKSLLILADKISDRENVGLVLADAVQFKTAGDYFDLAVSTQVFEHIPTIESRKFFLKNVFNSLKQSGRFVCSAYHQDLRRIIKKQPREGTHKSGIFFHYFSAGEIKKEFSEYFNVKKIKVIDITIPLEARFGLGKYFKGGVSRFFENIFFINLLGHLILINAEKKNNFKNIKNYSYGFIFPNFLKKYWFWFVDPFDVENSAMVNFFSYNKVDMPDFYRKEGMTSIIDLRQDLDMIWRKIRKKFTRDLIKKGEQAGIIVKKDNNFSGFKKIYRQFRRKKKIHADRFKVFQNGVLFSAYYQGNLIANHLFIADEKIARSWVAASKRLELVSGREKRIVGYANRQLIWQAINFFKDNGCETLDLGGIGADTTDKHEISLAEFKESFGGERKKCYYYNKVYSKLLKFWIKIRTII